MSDTLQTAIKLRPYQDDFYYGERLHPAMVSGWATGKTYLGILLGLKLSEESPGNLGLICRREYTDLADSTMKDFERYTGLIINRQRKEVTLGNGSVIMFRHAGELNLLKNINLGWFLMEQAEEFDTDTEFMLLKGRLRRQEAKRLKGMVIANTNGHNWVWQYWKSAPGLDYCLSEATTFDNQVNLRPDFISQLDDIKIKQPTIYNRYVLNSWEESDISDQVLPEALIRRCVDNNVMVGVPDTRRIIACDPARFGDDETVIVGLEGGSLKMIEVCNQQDTMATAGKLVIAAKKMRAKLIAVESTGLGAGICDRLREMDQPIHEVNPAERSRYPNRFKNLRSEIWWTAREKCEQREVNLPDDNTLLTQLSSAKYRMASDQVIAIEPKDQIKKRLGQSPDRADAVVIGLYALQFVANEANEVWGDSEPELVGKKINGARGW